MGLIHLFLYNKPMSLVRFYCELALMMVLVSLAVALIVSLLLTKVFAQEQPLTLEEVQRQKLEVQKDATIGQLMLENAQMKYQKLLQLEEQLKIKKEEKKAK